jgi:methionyl-tRNA synthetase
LDLSEEYENQQSWRNSHDKLTFIVCAPPPEPTKRALAHHVDIDDKMRGDVNFFLYPYETVDDAVTDEKVLVGEIDIMIAAKEHRGHGLGQAAVRALLVYIHRNLKNLLLEYDGSGDSELRGLMVKLKEGNKASRMLFERLGFEQKGEVNYFGEVMLVLGWSQLATERWWDESAKDFSELEYVYDTGAAQ